jgi:hypothetical protein
VIRFDAPIGGRKNATGSAGRKSKSVLLTKNKVEE